MSQVVMNGWREAAHEAPLIDEWSEPTPHCVLKERADEAVTKDHQQNLVGPRTHTDPHKHTHTSAVSC